LAPDLNYCCRTLMWNCFSKPHIENTVNSILIIKGMLTYIVTPYVNIPNSLKFIYRTEYCWQTTPRWSFSLFHVFYGKREKCMIWRMLLHHELDLSDFSHGLFSVCLSLLPDYVTPVIKVKVIQKTALGKERCWAEQWCTQESSQFAPYHCFL
jgi:hypothetical protein